MEFNISVVYNACISEPVDSSTGEGDKRCAAPDRPTGVPAPGKASPTLWIDGGGDQDCGGGCLKTAGGSIRRLRDGKALKRFELEIDRSLILALFTTLAYLSLLIHQQVRVISHALRQIDPIVYQYRERHLRRYGLTEEEIGIVEGGCVKTAGGSIRRLRNGKALKRFELEIDFRI